MGGIHEFLKRARASDAELAVACEAWPELAARLLDDARLATVAELLHDEERVGLARLLASRALAAGRAPPEWVCRTVGASRAELEDLEATGSLEAPAESRLEARRRVLERIGSGEGELAKAAQDALSQLGKDGVFDARILCRVTSPAPGIVRALAIELEIDPHFVSPDPREAVTALDLGASSRSTGDTLGAVAARALAQLAPFGNQFPRVAAREGDERLVRSIDEPSSAGLAILLAAYFASRHRSPIPATLLATGAVEANGRIAPVGGAREKLELAVATGAHVLLLPARNLEGLVDAGVAECGQETAAGEVRCRAGPIELVAVPETIAGDALFAFLEAVVEARYPKFVKPRADDLGALLVRAEHLVHTGHGRLAIGSLDFLIRVIDRFPDMARARDEFLGCQLRAIALRGQAHSHSADFELACRDYARARELAERLRSERRLTGASYEEALELDNRLAVALLDILDYEQAEELLLRNLEEKRASGLPSRYSIGRTHGSLGQLYAKWGLLEPRRFALAEEHLLASIEHVQPADEPRNRTYLAQLRVYEGRFDEADSLLEPLVATGANRPWAELWWCRAAARKALATRDRDWARVADRRCTESLPKVEGGGYLAAIVLRERAIARGVLAVNDDGRERDRIWTDLDAARAALGQIAPSHPDHLIALSTELVDLAIAMEDNDAARIAPALQGVKSRLGAIGHASVRRRIAEGGGGAMPADAATAWRLLGVLPD